MKTNSRKQTFNTNQIGPGIQVKGSMASGGYQPPRNRMVVSAAIRIIFAYSPRKNRAKDMLLYSTKKPATNSLSPSGKSNGARLVSASVEIKKITNIGKSGMKNQRFSCAFTMSFRLSEPTHISTVTITKPMLTS